MSGVLVEVSARRFAIPNECPCCGAMPDAEIAVAMTNKRAARTSAKQMAVPYCRKCIGHTTRWEAAGVTSAAVMLVGILTTIVGTIVVGVIGLLAIVIALPVAAYFAKTKRAAARATCGPSCASPGKALVYLGWSGTMTSFVFESPTYAARFAEQNPKLVVNASVQLKKLLEGHRIARLQVPTPAAAVDLAQPPPTLAAWIKKIEGTTGPAGRRNLVVRALDAISDETQRAELVAAVSQIDLRPVLAKLQNLDRGEERARHLAEAIAAVTADNLPAPVQDAELKELEVRLHAL